MSSQKCTLALKELIVKPGRETSATICGARTLHWTATARRPPGDRLPATWRGPGNMQAIAVDGAPGCSVLDPLRAVLHRESRFASQKRCVDTEDRCCRAQPQPHVLCT